MAKTEAANLTRDRLVSHALRLFARRGYDAVTVDEIVRSAKLTKGAFYHHFRSKEDCLAEIHTSFVEHALQRFQAIMDRGEDAEKTIRTLMSELFMQIRDYRAQVIVLWDSRRSLPRAQAKLVEAKKAEIRHFFTATIERGHREGLFDAAHDSHTAALGIFGMCMWAYHWYDPKGAQTPEQLATSFADLVVVGLAHKPTPAGRLAVQVPAQAAPPA
ncbi:MAG TPA: TetR/AcrR family transcriptional regulator [Pseudonocardiaceae bacterium]